MKTLVIAAGLLLWSAQFPSAHKPYPFEKYPVTKTYEGKPVPPLLDTPRSIEYRTRIRNGAKEGPNFAGHYTVISWGCGTSCGVYVIVDAQTGQVYWPPEISRGVELNVAEPEYRLNSTLMVVASCPPPEIYGYKDCKRMYYSWIGSKFSLLKSEPVTGSD
jgi:hypothetical protein